MADFGLFIGFGFPARGREAAATKVFQETMAYFGGLQASGEIERTEVALLDPHGGDLGGFILVRGEREALGKLRRSDEFQRLVARAGYTTDGVGVVNALLDGEAARWLGEWSALTADLV